MSSSEFVRLIAAGDGPLVAIPVFVSRLFRHSFIFVNAKSGVATPKDLAGKTIGVSAYTQTAAVFIRGLLQHEYGVDLSTVRWIQGPMNGRGGHPSLPTLSKPIRIELEKSGKALSELLAAGKIDATLGALVPDSFGSHPDVRRLIPNFREVEKSYFRRTRIFPIMHLIAIKRAVYEKHPFVARSLYAALSRAKDLAAERMREVGALAYMTPWLADDLREMDDVFGGDAWPYGIAPNRATLEALVVYMAEQGMIPAPINVEDLFVPI
jgi:4,5-dihydroxyphthalate decarboxylase